MRDSTIAFDDRSGGAENVAAIGLAEAELGQAGPMLRLGDGLPVDALQLKPLQATVSHQSTQGVDGFGRDGLVVESCERQHRLATPLEICHQLPVMEHDVGTGSSAR